MKVLFQCDNANHVHISHQIAHHPNFPKVEVEVLSLDWQKETFRWVSESIRRLNWRVPLFNMFDMAPKPARDSFTAAKAQSRQNLLQEICFEYLKKFVGVDDVFLIQFNDVSVRGNAIAHTCKKIGIERLLIQDGFLTFESKKNDIAASDQNYRWGQTAPAYVAVWGQIMQAQTVERHGLEESSVHVVGPTKHISIPEFITRDPSASPVRVLLADQAILDQAKADRESWLGEFKAIAEVIASFDASVRLHPSTTERNRIALLEQLPETVSVDDDPNPLDANRLKDFDCVVTYYSTVFLDCLAASVPCIIVRTKSLDIELPEIDHPLLTYCRDASELAQAIDTATKKKLLQAPRGADITAHISDHSGYGGCATLISSIHSQLPEIVEASPFSPLSGDYASNAALRRIEGKPILVVGTSFGRHIGVGKPIISYFREMRRCHLSIDFFLATSCPSNNMLLRAEASSILLINSLDVIKTLPPEELNKLLDRCGARNVPVLFYIHETQYVFEERRREHPARFKVFVDRILPNARFLAVSDQQAEWLRSIGASDIHVVYNSIGDFSSQLKSDRSSNTVLMVGTRQARKGVELFSRVADIAKHQGLPWRFRWLGSPTKNGNNLYHSPNVEWAGHVSEADVRRELQDCSLFFLSSIDDPMPLSVGEALASGVPAVVYRKTGFSDYISFHRCGEVFDYYDAEHAFLKIRSVLDRPDFYHSNQSDVNSIVGAKAFARRMTIALGSSILLRGQMKRTAAATPKPVLPLKTDTTTVRRPLTTIAKSVRPIVPDGIVRPMWLFGKKFKLI